MSDKIKVKATLSNLPLPGGKACYIITPKNTTKVEPAEFYRRYAKNIGVDFSRARFYANQHDETIFEYLRANSVVTTEGVQAKLSIGGSLSSVNDQPSKKLNPVTATITLRGELADRVSALELVNDTLTAGTVVHEVYQRGADSNNTLTETGALVIANLTNGKIDLDATDEGIWLESADGTVVATAEIVFTDSNVAKFRFATLPDADGVYLLVFACRNGESADEYAASRETRRVQLVTGD